jgi:hypothetical protein
MAMPTKTSETITSNAATMISMATTLLRNIKLGHELNNSRSHFYKAYTNLGLARANL